MRGWRTRPASRFKKPLPRTIVGILGRGLPKTSTGKIQKFGCCANAGETSFVSTAAATYFAGILTLRQQKAQKNALANGRGKST